MAVKITRALRNRLSSGGVAPAMRSYEDRHHSAQRGELKNAAESQTDIISLYYDLVTDFYEYGWGKSFHFAPRTPGETFKASLVRHEHRLADALELKEGMTVADLGCGIGGSMLEIARYSGAKIVGVNNNSYQLDRARSYAKQLDLSHLTEFIDCDFLNVDAPDESYDAIYSIEATCCAPNKTSTYGEILRLLKPGARFAVYEYCMTDRFDPNNPRHLKLKADIELGGGLINIDERQTVDDVLHALGFEVLETRDLAEQSGPSIPWYQPLAGSGLSFVGFRSSRIGRAITHGTLKALEALRIAPKGSARVAHTLNLCAAAMAEAGRLGIFTPMYFIHARKPDKHEHK